MTRILNTLTSEMSFSFSNLTVELFQKYVNRLNCKKAVGHDDMQPFFLKLAGEKCITSFCSLYNSCVSSCSFPDSLKMAEISPVFKKKDNLDKENYRSVNILTTLSKVFERILSDQLTSYFEKILSPNI